MNILATLAFEGTNYCGFQVQKNGVSVCEALQDAMEAVFHSRPPVKGCSRTDAGVHAREYCVSFQVDTAIPAEKLPFALNAHLPADIRVLRAAPVPEKFHARYSALGKRYEYVILNRAIDDPLRRGFYHRFPGALDLDAMNRAALLLTGTHDFASFAAAGSSVKSTVRTLARLDARREGDYIIITAQADGFLYNMVRILAGTLLAVGRGAAPPEAVADILAAKDRARAGDTLPAQGLFLTHVLYPAEFTHYEE